MYENTILPLRDDHSSSGLWPRVYKVSASTGRLQQSVQEEDIAITMSWFSLYIYSPQEGRRKQPFIKERWYLPVKIPSSKFVSVL